MAYITTRGPRQTFMGLDWGLRKHKYAKDGYVVSGYAVEVPY